MLDYKYTEPSTKSSIFRLKDRSKSSRYDFPGMYLDAHRCTFRESYSLELFDLSLDVPLIRETNQGYMAYVSLWIPLI